MLFNNVVFVVCSASLPIAVLGQPGWYTLSALVSQISGSVQVPTLSRIVARVSDGPRLELRSRQGIHSVYVYVLHTARHSPRYGGITVSGDEYGSGLDCRDISSSSGLGRDLNRSNGDCWDLNWIKM